MTRDLRDVLLVVSAHHPHSAALKAAAELARRHGARLDMLCSYVEPSASPAECFARGATAVGSVLAHIDARIAALLEAPKAAFEQTLRDAGLTGEWSALEDRDVTDHFPAGATVADLVVLPGFHAGIVHGLAEFLLLERGMACLLAPDEWTGSCKRVLIAWNGSEQAQRSVKRALPLLRRAEAVRIAVVADSAASDPVDAKPAAWLEAEGIACDHRRYQRGSGRDEEMIAQACTDFAADLLVMGAYGHSRVGEAILGGVTRHMLRHATIATYLAH